MRKAFGILLFAAVVLMCAVLLPAQAEAAEGTITATEGYYTYTVTSGKATITKCDTAISGKVMIPSTLGGYPVTAIGDQAFYKCTSLTGVTVPNSINKMGEGAFYGCTSLESISLPFLGSSRDSIKDESAQFEWIFGAYEIGGFWGAGGGWEVVWEASVPTTIKEVVVTDAKTIADKAFYECKQLTSITILSDVTSIGEYAFYNCASVTSVTIPNSVTSIEWAAFQYCSGLSDVFYGGTEKQWQEIVIGNSNSNLTNARRHYNVDHVSHTYQTIWSKDGISHWHECSVCGDKKDVASHTWDAGKVTKQSTCKEGGIKTYTCTVCQNTKTESIAKLTTHAYEYVAGGKHKCTDCGATNTHYHAWGGWTSDENGHWHTCVTVPRCGEKVQYAVHTWNEGEVTKEATEAETGVKTYTCTVCEAKKETVLDKLIPAPTDPTTIPTEPTTEPTTVPTEPTTEPTTVPTEPTTMPTTAPTEPTPSTPATDGDQTGNDTGWIILIVVLAAVVGGLGGGMAVFLIVKKKLKL
ncbi:MAG: leucine-rich repeat domain-containing protein [Ruminococcaceae bacterium]|nr:leucine-rich repeat domain-containing protein [Oscillospiraceae bacterium]